MNARTLMQASAVATALVLSPLAAQAAPAGTYTLDATHTFVVFKVDRANFAPVYGMFVGADGSFYYDEGNASKMKVDLTLDTEKIYTGVKKRDGHLTSPDFFNAKQFPKITFKSDSVKRSGNDYTVKGTLTMHGKSKATTLKLEKVGEGKNQQGQDVVSFEGSVTINRKDFGIAYGDGFIQDEIELMIAADGLK